MNPHDADLRKGSIEDTPYDETHPGEAHLRLAAQLPHRDSDPLLKDSDSDFPEPGPSPEHS